MASRHHVPPAPTRPAPRRHVLAPLTRLLLATPRHARRGGEVTTIHGYNVDHIVVEPRADSRWARQRNGTKRAASLHDTDAEAEAPTQAEAKRWHAELVVKGENSQTLRRDSYGGDRARRPG